MTMMARKRSPIPRLADDYSREAAAKRMTGKATARACGWILADYPGVRQFCLESNLATDKKSSQINILDTRGKRVTAEATIPVELVRQVMRTTPEQLFRARQLWNLGGLMSGVHSNGNHSANGIAAMSDGAYYYYSITIAALIVATCGGGTGLPTQRECLELLGCYGAGKVLKFAEIVAATALCGELSLGSAIVAGEWVGAHERLGRNRPALRGFNSEKEASWTG
jgi:hydroxymethylglutaryl-CoA reductase (NADPH)